MNVRGGKVQISYTWVGCDFPGCEREQLAVRVPGGGWVERDGELLCPDHAPDVWRDVPDFRTLAAGDRA